MRALTSEERTNMQATQDSAMLDTCVLLTHSEGETDEYGISEDAFSASNPLSCGFNDTPGGSFREVMQDAQVVMIDAQLRLPIDTDVSHRDRIKITHRYGEPLASAPVFEIVGVPHRGPSGLLLKLRLVTDGSC